MQSASAVHGTAFMSACLFFFLQLRRGVDGRCLFEPSPYVTAAFFFLDALSTVFFFHSKAALLRVPCAFASCSSAIRCFEVTHRSAPFCV